jgi:SAM-dependent methyltransferase
VQLNDVIPRLLPPPARVLEVGCGDGDLARALAAGGYEVVAIDPHAPEGGVFRRMRIEELDELDGPGPFDLVVADRVLHHVDPLEPVLDKLARLAPLLVVGEFAWERIDAPTQEWYEALHRRLVSTGHDPVGPADLDAWRWDHQDLHRSDRVLAGLASRYTQVELERGPYFYRWLRVPGVEAEERRALAAGEIQPIGLRYAGRRR